MTTAIYYFSGTGNSLSIARILNNHLEESDIFPIIGSLKQRSHTVNAQRVGIVFPMHYMTIPAIVCEFIKKVIFKQPKYVFVVITGANPRFGNALSVVTKCLAASDMKLNAGYLVPTVAAHFPYISLQQAKVPRQQYKETQLKALQIVESVGKLKNELDKEFAFMGNLKDVFPQVLSHNDHYFSRDKGCIRCGYCMQVCPFNNIRLHGNEVQWLDNCQHCFACVHYCSKSVIQYKKVSVGKPRHHHPCISIRDIASQRDIDMT